MSFHAAVAFSKDGLFKFLSNNNATTAEIPGNDRAQYLYRYLKDLSATTIVVEEPYTDRDYLDDYTAYYSRCYASYDRRCRRLHIFRGGWKEQQLRRLFRKPNASQERKLQRDYLGFIVVRPLPEAVVGRSILQTYGEMREGAQRRFPTSRAYKVNLFGIPLVVNGLAYQEQDTVLAACATVSLWSAFHRTGDLFGTDIPTPAKITAAATNPSTSFRFGRPIPQHSLRVEEVCGAIRHNGLEPEAVSFQNPSKKTPLASLLYAYLSAGLPIVLLVQKLGSGGHAITLTGFSLRENRVHVAEIPGNSSIPPMVGLRIDQFYGHDDQIGPHAKLIVNETPKVIPRQLPTRPPIRFISDHIDIQGKPFLYPLAVAIPIYNKIRLTFADVQNWITPLHAVIEDTFQQKDYLEWDVTLVFSNKLKEELRRDEQLSAEARDSLLLVHHPRFWWRATLRYSGIPICHLLFDATGIARSFPLSCVIWPHEPFAVFMESVLVNPSSGTLRMLKRRRYADLLHESLKVRATPGTLLKPTVNDP